MRDERLSGSRSGTTLARSRGAILAGARKAVLASGTRITMSQVATEAGVAKATLYNHFRTREELLHALLLDEIDGAVEKLGRLELGDALRRAACLVSDHPLLEALGAEPDVLADLARVDVRSDGWKRIADAVDVILGGYRLRGAPTILRWLSSFIAGPADASDIALDVEILLYGLQTRRGN